ncbi:MAG: RHS repeat protein [Dehalococcoidia bacterium]|nr:RHS repeat protein [Dehalococcoidia bacterium]
MTYGYDNANRLTTVTAWNSNSTTYSYDDAGRMTTATLPSGTCVVSTNSYDDANRLTGISELLVAHMIDSLMSGTAGVACAESAGPACVFSLASAAAHRRIFKVLTDETQALIVERGRLERRKNDLIENWPGARCVLSGEC